MSTNRKPLTTYEWSEGRPAAYAEEQMRMFAGGILLTLKLERSTLKLKESLIPQLEAEWKLFLKGIQKLTYDSSSSETTG